MLLSLIETLCEQQKETKNLNSFRIQTRCETLCIGNRVSLWNVSCTQGEITNFAFRLSYSGSSGHTKLRHYFFCVRDPILFPISAECIVKSLWYSIYLEIRYYCNYVRNLFLNCINKLIINNAREKLNYDNNTLHHLNLLGDLIKLSTLLFKMSKLIFHWCQRDCRVIFIFTQRVLTFECLSENYKNRCTR